MVLCARLRQWFTHFREQAGAQEKRGCVENIVALRLLCDMARRRKLTLFVTFIDFSQAYDRVPRHKLFYVLRRLGCGSAMLCALIAMYTVTESLVGTVVVLITLGVRQGSPIMFTFYHLG
uniref:Reverse transcriptase domain-containing protein n=1 Tax=Scylla olivacea TaxID=85551 RepID=A0A0P4VXZ4_SCYOL